MRLVVVAALLGWLTFQGSAIALLLSGYGVLGWLAEVFAVVDAALLWLYGARGGSGKIATVTTTEGKARG
jgi:hypothetical protein